MQLKLQRSQRMGGILAGTVVFCLDVRADYTEDERRNINKYKLGGQVIYNSQAARKHLERAGAHLGRTQNRGDLKDQFGGLAHGAFSMALAKMSLNISIASLGRGHHIECKDLDELLEAEDTVREACKNVTRYLQVAETFNGSEVVVEYENGEEKVHIAQPTPALIGPQAEEWEPGVTDAEFEEYDDAEPEFAGPSPVVTDPPDDPFLKLGRYIGRLGKKLVEQWAVLWPKIIEFIDTKGGGALKQKAAEFASSKGWDTLPHRAAEQIKQRWFAFEQGSIALAGEKGFALSATHIRTTCGIVAFLTVASLAFLVAFALA